jgi:CheY-like chemotaxis protein
MVTEANTASIVAAIIALAHKLRLHVVAEGVELETQLAFLRRLGCDEIQGFLFSKPLPEADYLALLRQGATVPGQEAAEAGGRTLLLVDDEPGILASLRRMFRPEGYRILLANSAAEGLDLLALEDVQVVISDQRMPGMTGSEFLTRVKDMHPDCLRIILSGQADMASVLEAINDGAVYKFLTKPWDDDQLRARVRDAFRVQAALTSAKATQQ